MRVDRPYLHCFRTRAHHYLPIHSHFALLLLWSSPVHDIIELVLKSNLSRAQVIDELPVRAQVKVNDQWTRSMGGWSFFFYKKLFAFGDVANQLHMLNLTPPSGDNYLYLCIFLSLYFYSELFLYLSAEKKTRNSRARDRPPNERHASRELCVCLFVFTTTTEVIRALLPVQVTTFCIRRRRHNVVIKWPDHWTCRSFATLKLFCARSFLSPRKRKKKTWLRNEQKEKKQKTQNSVSPIKEKKSSSTSLRNVSTCTIATLYYPSSSSSSREPYVTTSSVSTCGQVKDYITHTHTRGMCLVCANLHLSHHSPTYAH